MKKLLKYDGILFQKRNVLFCLVGFFLNFSFFIQEMTNHRNASPVLVLVYFGIFAIFYYLLLNICKYISIVSKQFVHITPSFLWYACNSIHTISCNFVFLFKKFDHNLCKYLTIYKNNLRLYQVILSFFDFRFKMHNDRS